MKTTNIICFAIICIASLCGGFRVASQNIGINPLGNLPDASAALDIDFNNKGLLLPRMTTAQRDSINGGVIAQSLLIFNTDVKCIQIYIGTAWENFYCSSATFTCGGTLTDSRDSKTYSTVLIGTQCWMAQNLNYGNYVDIHSGTQIAGEKYCSNISGVNDSSCPLGGLYEWANMMNGSSACNGTVPPPDVNAKCATPVQGICPDGWHIPSHYEWTLLEKNVGSNPSAFPYDITTTGSLGTDEGGALKQAGTSNWTSPNNGATNSSGFTALPGGYSGSGLFVAFGISGYWWSATGSGANAWDRSLHNFDTRSFRYSNQKISGKSVRCVKD